MERRTDRRTNRKEKVWHFTVCSRCRWLADCLSMTPITKDFYGSSYKVRCSQPIASRRKNFRISWSTFWRRKAPGVLRYRKFAAHRGSYRTLSVSMSAYLHNDVIITDRRSSRENAQFSRCFFLRMFAQFDGKLTKTVWDIHGNFTDFKRIVSRCWTDVNNC